MSVYKVIGIFASLLFFYTPSHAQEDNQESTNKVKQKVERIEVRGKKSRRFFFKEYINYQRNFVTSFNDLVDDREMQVVCETEKYTRSRIKKKNCQPRFINTIITKETQLEISRAIGGDISDPATIQRLGNVSERPVVQAKTREEFKKFQELTAKLLNEHPELADTYIKMEEALEKYQDYKKN